MAAPRKRPNVLFVMTDQQRADTIAALGNPHIHTPHMDALVRRGVSCTNAYSTCPVCMPARYTVRTGREPSSTAIWGNGPFRPAPGQAATVEGRCGPYLARTMGRLGYRTFGIGKFHSNPEYEDLGFRVHLHTEELLSRKSRSRDAYGGFIARRHPEHDWLEELHGERTAMYYIPQRSPLPAELTVEAFVADRTVEQLKARDRRPFFGFVSFIGPHPPFAPPVPFNRMYNPDRMPDPRKGDPEVDGLDGQIAWMNHAIYADDINGALARHLKARYYGEITYIDHCLGRIMKALEKRGDADNTLLCFFSDHGDHLGDHGAWQKESFFEGSARVPFLVSWPGRLKAGTRCGELVCLTDLFGIATSAAGRTETRDGIDVLGMLEGSAAPRETLFGLYGVPGTPDFKVMVRQGPWKYIFMANGGREQLFNLADDPDEVRQLLSERPDTARKLRAAAAASLRNPAGAPALEGNDLHAFPFTARPPERIWQFDASKGVRGFPEHPGDVL